MAKITILSMYRWMKSEGRDLFSLFNLPIGLDKDLAVNKIILECNDLELLYPDPDFFNFAIGNWSLVNQKMWQKWNEVLNASYNPLENYNGKETITQIFDKEHTSSTTGEVEASQEYGSATSSTTTDPHTDTMTDKVSAFDSDTMSDNTQSTAAVGQIHSSSTSDPHTDKATTSEHTDTFDKDARTDTVITEKAGNLGVTTSQQMIQSELDLRRFNIYKEIAQDFKREFCICIY